MMKRTLAPAALVAALLAAPAAAAAQEAAAPAPQAAPAEAQAAPAAAAPAQMWAVPEEEKQNPVPYLVSVYVIVLESILLLFVTTQQRMRRAVRKVEALHG